MSRFHYASQDLVDVLTKEGFDDLTEKRDKNHYDRLLKNGYNPDNVKRYFQIRESPYSTIYFDYINISLSTKNGQYLFHWKQLSKEQLRGVISFCKLPNKDQRELTSNGFDVLEIPEIIEDMNDHYTIYREVIYTRLKANYDSIRIN